MKVWTRYHESDEPNTHLHRGALLEAFTIGTKETWTSNYCPPQGLCMEKKGRWDKKKKKHRISCIMIRGEQKVTPHRQIAQAAFVLLPRVSLCWCERNLNVGKSWYWGTLFFPPSFLFCLFKCNPDAGDSLPVTGCYHTHHFLLVGYWLKAFGQAGEMDSD